MLNGDIGEADVLSVSLNGRLASEMFGPYNMALRRFWMLLIGMRTADKNVLG